tara:strand:+ start:2747 stop:5047 length:2301 start_codon:yes stop_codon:yes gene_type:complete
MSFKTTVYAYMAGSCSIALLAAGPVKAQDESGVSDIQGNEIVVTAQKRSQSVNDVPLTVAAATGEQMVARGVDGPGDLGKIVPGFTFQPAATGVPVYTLRGVGYFDESLGASPAVSIYVDEVPLPFSIMTGGVAFDLERVEVLKGPQGTLFGQNSTGGAINYVAAKPTDYATAGGSVSFSRFATADVQGYVSGPLADTLNARLAVRAVRGDDWQESYTRDDSLGQQNLNQARLLLDWQPTYRLKVALNANGWIDRSDTQAPQVIAITPQNPANMLPFVTNFPLTPQDSRSADWTPNRDYAKNDRFYQFSGRIDYDLTDDVTVTSLTAYSKMLRDAFVEGDGTPYENVDLRNFGYLESIDQELRLTAKTGGFNLIIGANYEHNKTKDIRTFFIGDASTREIVPGFVHDGAELRTYQDIDTYAVFGNIEYALNDEFSLLGGIRYTKQNRAAEMCSADAGNNQIRLSFTALESLFKGGALVDEIPPGGCMTFDENFNPGPVFDELNEDNISWKLGANWTPNSDALIYVSASRGYKAGSFPTIFATSAAQNAPVTQETLLSFEAGTKLTMGSAQINAAAFYYDYKDKQLLGKSNDVNFGVLQTLVNIPESTLYGGELQLMWQPIDGLDLSAAATYTHSRIDEYIGLTATGVPDDLEGSPFPYAPKLQIVSDIQYTGYLPDGKSFFIGGGATYNSSTTGGIGDEPLLRIKPYTLVDLRAGIEGQSGWSVSVWGRNVLNEYYWVNAQRTQDTTLRITGRPATYGITLGVKFQ